MFTQFDFGCEFFALLEQFDEASTRQVAAKGCPVCRGPLHRGDYDRKPRGGVIASAGEEFLRRFSLCCGREGCRKRAMPPSLRFLGRRVYLGVVVIVASMVAQAKAAASKRLTGVPRRTTQRWIAWWQGPFLRTDVFLALRALLIGVAIEELPASIVLRFAGSATQQVRAMLEWLAPLTTSAVPERSRFVRDAP
jgi:hypothetical protein